MEPLNKDQTIRFQLAVACQGRWASIESLEAQYQWVMGPKQSIMPVSKFELVKQ